jgi:hypothetical protein
MNDDNELLLPQAREAVFQLHAARAFEINADPDWQKIMPLLNSLLWKYGKFAIEVDKLEEKFHVV